MFIVDIGDFFSLGKSTAEAFLGFSKVIPDDESLRRALVETTRWATYKQGMVKSVKADQTNNRQDFDHQLRNPPQIPKKQQDKSKTDTSAKKGFPEKYRQQQFMSMPESNVTPNYASTFSF